MKIVKIGLIGLVLWTCYNSIKASEQNTPTLKDITQLEKEKQFLIGQIHQEINKTANQKTKNG